MNQTLQDLVLSYFRLFPDLAEINEKPAEGVATVALRGELADRFHNQGISGPEGSGQRVLKLLLKSDHASIATGFETLSPDSHLVRMIQNQLEQEDSLYCRTKALLSVSGTFQDLMQRGLHLKFARPATWTKARNRRFFVVSFLYAQAVCERLEDTIRVGVEYVDSYAGQFATDAGCKVLEPARVKYLTEMSCIDIATAHGTEPNELLPPLSREAMEQVLAVAQNAAQERVGKVSTRRMTEALRKLDDDRRRTEAYFETQVKNDTSAFRRKQAEAERAERLKHLDELSQVRAELELLSVQELFVPIIEYVLVLDQNREIPQRFFYDPIGNGLTTSACPNCRRHPDALYWTYCELGNHLECENCNSVKTCKEPNCCHTACNNHQKNCSICDEFVCPECTSFCPSCGNRHCSSPMCFGPVEDRAEEICSNCRVKCGDCVDSLLHHKDDVCYCSNCSKSLCGKHKHTCVSCHAVLCGVHTIATVSGDGCAECFAHCRSCQSDILSAAPAKHRSALHSCVACPEGDAGLHCTAHQHSVECVCCSRFVCRTHRIRLGDGRWSCPSCSRQCADCKDWFDRSTLHECAECRESVCGDHFLVSQFQLAESSPSSATAANAEVKTGQQFCRKCAGLLFGDCPGCDRRGPRRQLSDCPQCAISYCPDCRALPRGGHCHHCQSLQDFPLAKDHSPFWRDLLATAARGDLTEQAWREVRLALNSRRAEYDWSLSESRSHRLLRGVYRVRWQNWLFQWMRRLPRFLIIVDKQTGAAVVRSLS